MVNGTLIWYYYICKRQVWLISRSIGSDQENELMILGKHIFDIFKKRHKLGLKEIVIDNKIKLDYVKDKIIVEVKKSSKYLQASKMQLCFYLYYHKKYKNLSLSGKLVIPEENKIIDIALDEDIESEIESAISDIQNIINQALPPKPIKIQYCRKCAYKDLCWS
ncbi:MAG: CRISPR-associated protein Cas4 [candidate division WOR-3 bacterium]|nr:CRISPR-associated protein Cas4 [candidate division WOR-3 bacterium]MDW8151293.1 CRISPR-associated protein Cas4 [candidate division WOR-3 bacterium]